MTKLAETKEVEKVATAVLSTTARAAARAKKHNKDGGDAMDIDKDKDLTVLSATSATAPAGNALTGGDEAKKDDEEKKEEKKKKEPAFEILENLSRVVPSQLKYVKFREGSRYGPVKKVGSFVLLCFLFSHFFFRFSPLLS